MRMADVISEFVRFVHFFAWLWFFIVFVQFGAMYLLFRRRSLSEFELGYYSGLETVTRALRGERAATYTLDRHNAKVRGGNQRLTRYDRGFELAVQNIVKGVE